MRDWYQHRSDPAQLGHPRDPAPPSAPPRRVFVVTPPGC
jgi:hypothetical protein